MEERREFLKNKNAPEKNGSWKSTLQGLENNRSKSQKTRMNKEETCEDLRREYQISQRWSGAVLRPPSLKGSGRSLGIRDFKKTGRRWENQLVQGRNAALQTQGTLMKAILTSTHFNGWPVLKKSRRSNRTGKRISLTEISVAGGTKEKRGPWIERNKKKKLLPSREHLKNKESIALSFSN